MSWEPRKRISSVAFSVIGPADDWMRRALTASRTAFGTRRWISPAYSRLCLAISALGVDCDHFNKRADQDAVCPQEAASRCLNAYQAAVWTAPHGVRSQAVARVVECSRPHT